MELKNKKNKNTIDIDLFGVDAQASHTTFPLLMTHVSAGFPSPADDYIEQKLDLNEYLVKHPVATFFMRVEGNSMIDAGIQSGDIVIVDRALSVSNGAIVIAHIQGECTVKRVELRDNQVYLVPANKKYPLITITPEMDIEIWGVVTYVIHKAT